MKKFLYLIVIFILFVFLLTNPVIAVKAAENGLLLWFHTIIPTLLPFMILSGLIIKLDGIKYITGFLAPVFYKALHISKNGCYAVLIGFLCGYPMGAKITADLFQHHKITKSEAQYLLSFCNNVSPMFIVSFFVMNSLKRPDLLMPILVILYSTPLCCALLYQFFYRKKLSFNNYSEPCIEKKAMDINFQLIDEAIMDGFVTVTKLGGYIILFSIISELLLYIPFTNNWQKYLSVSLIEITCGIKIISFSNLQLTSKLLYLLPAIAFGGLSSLAQTESMIRESGLSILGYLTAKFFNLFLALIFTLIFIF